MSIPKDHAIWSIFTGDLVNDLLRELPSNRSPVLQRLFDILVQHPSSTPLPGLVGQQVWEHDIRNGINVSLKKRKRKSTEMTSGDGTGNKRKSKKERVWMTDGIPPGPTPAAFTMLSKMGSVISRANLHNLVKLVQALVNRKVELVKEDDYRLESTLKMCDINCTNRALQDFYHMIGYIRLGFHLDR
jgi:hypothetical protein